MVRGFFLGRLRILFSTGQSWMGDALSVIISSVIFGLGHLYQGWFGVMKTTVAGICLAILVLLTKSVWPAMIAHAGIDTATIVMLHFLTPLVEKALKFNTIDTVVIDEATWSLPEHHPPSRQLR